MSVPSMSESGQLKPWPSEKPPTAEPRAGFIGLLAAGTRLVLRRPPRRHTASLRVPEGWFRTGLDTCKVRRMDNIRGKTIVITGAARGIGYATAQALLARGARVVIGDRDLDVLESAVAGISSLGQVTGHP